MGAWLLAVASSEVAVHGVGEAILGVMPMFATASGALAVLAVQRYRHTRLPHWLLAGFTSTLLSVNGLLYAYTDIGLTLEDLHLASDTAALGTAFFLLTEAVVLGGGPGGRRASLAGLLSCCALGLLLPAVLFGLVPASPDQLLELIVSEHTASLFALPAWLPLAGLLPAVAGLHLGNRALGRGRRGGPSAPGGPMTSETTSAPGRVIGWWGTAARAVVGVGLVVAAFTWAGASWLDVLLGVMVLPAVATLLLGLRGPAARPLRLGAAGHLVTVAIVALLVMMAPEAALLFYGSTMLVAALHGNGGCEVTAVSNWLRGRDDQIGCPLFAPVDALDTTARKQERQR
ncbi:MAG: hypothetical protein M3N52_00505 [Actinomycetota bacterium]|nr:hypothetical protein [Actinomycetota bacterium]